MTRFRRFTLLAFLLTAGLSASGRLRADTYDAMLARAVAAKERALDHNDLSAWEDALGLFREVDGFRATKETKYEIGAAAARLKQDDLAVESYEAALALGLDGLARTKAEAFVAEKQSQMARVLVRGPVGAEIYVAGRLRGRLPLTKPMVLFAGPSRLRVAAFRTVELDVMLEPGKVRELDLTSRLADTQKSGDALTPAGPPRPRSDADERTSASERPPLAAPSARAMQGIAGSNGFGPNGFSGATASIAPSGGDTILAPLLLGSGTALAIAGAVTVIFSSGTIDEHRIHLADVCATSTRADRCDFAKQGQRDAAQADVDAIATWKVARVFGWVGLGAGAIALSTGSILLFRARARTPAQTLRPIMTVAPRPDGMLLGVKGLF